MMTMRRDAGFSIFYMGDKSRRLSFSTCLRLSRSECPIQSLLHQASALKRRNLSWHFGFGAAGVGMCLGLIASNGAIHNLGLHWRSYCRRQKSNKQEEQDNVKIPAEIEGHAKTGALPSKTVPYADWFL